MSDSNDESKTVGQNVERCVEVLVKLMNEQVQGKDEFLQFCILNSYLNGAVVSIAMTLLQRVPHLMRKDEFADLIINLSNSFQDIFQNGGKDKTVSRKQYSMKQDH